MAAAPGYTIFYTVLIALSFFPNALVILAFLHSHRRMTLKDAYLVSMAVADLSRAVLGHVPEVVALSKHGGLESNDFACQASGFVVTFLALVSISHMIYLALERLMTIVYPFVADKLTGIRLWLPCSIALIWMYGLIWAAPPLLGWCRYHLDDSAQLCSIDWRDTSASGRSYILTLFVFCFVIPGSAMFASFFLVRRELRNMHKRAGEMFGKEHVASESTRLAEVKHSKMVFIMVLAFMVAWTPYSVVSFLVTFAVEVPFVLLIAAAYLGKSSAFFNPFIYVFYCGSYRSAVRRLFLKGSVDPASGTSRNPTVVA